MKKHIFVFVLIFSFVFCFIDVYAGNISVYEALYDSYGYSNKNYYKSGDVLADVIKQAHKDIMNELIVKNGCTFEQILKNSTLPYYNQKYSPTFFNTAQFKDKMSLYESLDGFQGFNVYVFVKLNYIDNICYLGCVISPVVPDYDSTCVYYYTYYDCVIESGAVSNVTSCYDKFNYNAAYSVISSHLEEAVSGSGSAGDFIYYGKCLGFQKPLPTTPVVIPARLPEVVTMKMGKSIMMQILSLAKLLIPLAISYLALRKALIWLKRLLYQV